MRELSIGRNSDNNVPNGMACGYHKRESNIFFSECSLEGYGFPTVKVNDIVSLIYNSNDNSMSFLLNNKTLSTKIVNIPTNYELFWFVGKWGSTLKVSIIDA